MKFRFAVISLFVVLLINCSRIADTPKNIDVLLDNYFSEVIRRDPETAARLGLTEEMGFTIEKDKLSDTSIKAVDEEFVLVKKYYKLLKKYDQNKLTKDQQISAAIFKIYLENIIESERFRYHWYQLNPNFGIHYFLINLMTEYHNIESLKDAEDYISRLNQFPQRFDHLFEDLEKKEKLGIMPPPHLIGRFSEILSESISPEPLKNVYFTSFAKKIENLDCIDKETAEVLYLKALMAIDTCVYPSYQKLIDHCHKMSSSANDDAGVWKLPEGDEYYKFCLKNHTTTDLTPEEIHQMGLKEVDRIQKIMLELFATLGFSEGDTFGEIEGKYWNSLDKADRRFFYSRTEESKEKALQDYNDILGKTKDKLPELFSLIPKTPVIVKRIPGYQESFSGQHYKAAPLDGSRPAAFYTNLSWLPFKPGMQTLLYHETIPGHHLQIAIAQESDNVHIFRQLTFFTGYIEGWALYAEKLGYEREWYEDTYSVIGYLNSELFRAVRLVVDTGIHYKKWSREQAYEYMKENLGWGSYGEIDRYILWPGQACAYKVGELKILELREKAKKELKNKFDLKEFHKVILENGALPLYLLEEIVDEYIEVNCNSNQIKIN